MIEVTSLAGFKRFLALPGATVTVIRHDWADKGVAGYKDPARVAAIYAPRTVAKLQTNAVKFSNQSWLYFDKSGGRLHGKLTFEGDKVTLALGIADEVCVYQLSLQEVS